MKIHSALLDGGASFHLTGNLDLLSNIREIENPTTVVGFRDEFVSRPTLMGDLDLVVFNSKNEPIPILIPDVRYDEKMSLTIWAEGLLLRAGMRGDARMSHTEIIRVSDEKPILMAVASPILKWIKFMKRVEFENVALEEVMKTSMRCDLLLPVRQSSRDKELTVLYHRRYGHCSAKRLVKMVGDLTGNARFKVLPEVLYECDVCLRAKSTRAPHISTRVRGVRILEIVNTDLMGPLTPARTGERYIITLIDDYSLYAFSYAVHTRDQYLACFEDFFKIMSTQFPGFKIAIVRSDNAPEITKGQFRAFCNSKGILQESSPAYTPELNGRAERFNRTLLEKTRCILLDGNIPVDEWPLAVQMACWLINRTPTSSNPQWRSPYELVFRKKPNLSYVRVPGCEVFMHIDKEKRVEKKFGARALRRVLIGFESNGIQVIDPITRTVSKTCNFKAVETRTWRDVVEALSTEPSENFIPDPTMDHSYAWVYLSRDKQVKSLSDDVPKTYQEALKSPYADEWRKAIQSEYDSLIENDVWEPVRKADIGKAKLFKLITTRWIFTVKFLGMFEIPKARLVARGFQDRNSYTVTETYSPVINHSVIRWLISFSNKHKLALVAIDVKTAFLYGEIDHDVYISVPEGYVTDSDVVALKLKKSLYGLKTSSKTWFTKFSSALLAIGFKAFMPDQCVFIMFRDEQIFVIVVYVDDCLFAFSDEKQGQAILDQLADTFKIKVMPKPKIFVGLQISRSYPDYFVINQQAYILRLGAKFNVFPPQHRSIPMQPRLRLIKKSERSEYPDLRALIGGLLFVARCARPDIMFAVNYLSRFVNVGSREIFDYAIDILKYLVSTDDYSLVYRSNDPRPIVTFVDASFADAIDDKYQSTGGYLVFCHGDLVAWANKKYDDTDTSTAGAELRALNHAVNEVIFIRALNNAATRRIDPALIYEDNISALHIANGTETPFSRFLMTKQWAIRQAITNGEIVVKKCTSAEQLADILTKALDRSKFQKIRDFLLRKVSE